MPAGIIWLLIFTGFFLAFCLITVASSATTALVVVLTIAGITVVVWRREAILLALRTLAAATVDEWQLMRERQRTAAAKKAEQQRERQTAAAAEAKKFSKRRELTHFHTKVVGVTRENDNGSSRQSVIKKCRVGEHLDLLHDRKNRYDKNAIKVCRTNGSQLGFLDSDLAGDIAEETKAGYFFTAYVSSLTGGTIRKPNRGCNILVVRFEESIPADVVTAYAESVLAKNA